MKKIIGLLIVLGSLSWSLTMVKSGIRYVFGIGYWGANGHDGVWHISLANNIANGSLENPVLSGEKIKNYHLGYDYLLVFLHKLTGLDIATLYFQILPVLISLLVGYLVYIFVDTWIKDKRSALYSLFFVYFGGSMAWLIGRGESAFWSIQAISTLINPPFASSLVVLLLGLTLYAKKKDKFKAFDYLILGSIFASLFLIKIYAGILMLGGLLVVGVYSLAFKKQLQDFKLFVITLLLSLLFYLPFNKDASSLVIWQPFWYLETLFAVGDRIPWPKMAEAMASYKNQSVVIKFMLAYGFAFVVFIVGNFWTRLIFLNDLFKNMKTIKEMDEAYLLILSIIAGGVIAPTLFVQGGTAWNSIQFMYYSLFLSAVLVGIAVSRLNKYLFILLLLFTIPTTVLTLKDVYIPGRPPAMLSNSEIEALEFLRKQADGIVFTYPFDMAVNLGPNYTAPVPLYKYASTSYISAYSGKQQFFERTNLDIMGYDWEDRFEKIQRWYKESNQDVARKFLSEYNIKYVYWVKPQRALLGDKQLGLEQIFENEEVIIYRYDQSIGSN